MKTNESKEEKNLKITVCSVVKNDTFFLEMMLKSALEFADEIIITDDSDDDKNLKLCEKLNRDNKIKHFVNHFGDNFGKGRQFAHDQATGDWILWLDADEVIHEGNTKIIPKLIKQLISFEIDVCHVEYLHFINDFTHVDNSCNPHIGLYRLYKNYGKEIKFITTNHSLPKYNWKKLIFTDKILIWHLGYLRGMEKIKERFLRNYRYGTLEQPRWRDWHYFGDYPTRTIDPKIIPKVLRNGYLMDLGDSFT